MPKENQYIFCRKPNLGCQKKNKSYDYDDGNIFFSNYEGFLFTITKVEKR